jgi:hypothetical protein
MEGTIITFGRRAATIQTKNGQQFYAPCRQLSSFVINDLLKEGVPLTVIFDIDKMRYAGHTHTPRYAGHTHSRPRHTGHTHTPRYYAINVELKNIIFL